MTVFERRRASRSLELSKVEFIVETTPMRTPLQTAAISDPREMMNEIAPKMFIVGIPSDRNGKRRMQNDMPKIPANKRRKIILLSFFIFPFLVRKAVVQRITAEGH